MKIEPAGVDRDRQIAELRDGNKWDTCSQVKEGLCLPWASDTDPCDECHRTPYKPYSTDISAAMELWADMREVGAQPSLTVVQDFVACEAWVNYGDDNADLISNLGDDKTDKSTEAGAISECYVNWKVANNG